MPPSQRPPAPSPHARHWALDPRIVYLNHGSFGATHTPVLAAQRAFQDRMEQEPVRFFIEHATPLLDAARARLADFLYADAQGLAPVTNATTGVATALHSLWNAGVLAPGSTLLATTHEYPACLNNLRAVAARAGASVRLVDLPFPCADPRQVVDAVLAAADASTRALLISHVTSASGMVLPVEPIVHALEARGVRTIVDGAHAPGMLPGLNLRDLNASYYTGNCHKWLCTPKGSAFLCTREDLRPGTRPLVLSNSAEAPIPGRDHYLTEFDYVGTADISAFLSIPAAMDFLASLEPGGLPGLIARNHALMLQGRKILCEALGIQPPLPESMLGSIATLTLPPFDPDRARAWPAGGPFPPLFQQLYARWGIEVPVGSVPGKQGTTLRISAQAYNSAEQYAYLARALVEELGLAR